MVAQRSSNRRCKTALYLALLILIACTETQYTVVKLEHKSPNELIPIIEHQLKDDIKYHTTGQTIVFYAQQADIENTLALLAEIDKPNNQINIYTLEFSWRNPERLSTTNLPEKILLAQDQISRINLFNKHWIALIQAANKQQIILTIQNKQKRKLKHQQQYILTLDQPSEMKHPLLPEGLILTINKA